MRLDLPPALCRPFMGKKTRHGVDAVDASCPSTVQSRGYSCSAPGRACDNWSLPLPSDNVQNKSNLPRRFDANRTRAPSGDHTGSVSDASSNVSRRARPLAVSIVQISSVPTLGFGRLTATSRSSGESAGLPYSPVARPIPIGRLVDRTTPVRSPRPSDTRASRSTKSTRRCVWCFGSARPVRPRVMVRRSTGTFLRRKVGRPGWLSATLIHQVALRRIEHTGQDPIGCVSGPVNRVSQRRCRPGQSACCCRDTGSDARPGGILARRAPGLPENHRAGHRGWDTAGCGYNVNSFKGIDTYLLRRSKLHPVSILVCRISFPPIPLIR